MGGTAQNPLRISAVVCPTCQYSFKEDRVFKRHSCLITIASEDVEPDFHIRGQEEFVRLTKAFQSFGSSSKNIIDFCEETKTAMPGLYPLFFPPAMKNPYPVLTRFGSVADESYTFLLSAARVSTVKLRKVLTIREGNKTYLFQTPLLLPNAHQRLESFSLVEKPDHVAITVKKRKKCQVR